MVSIAPAAFPPANFSELLTHTRSGCPVALGEMFRAYRPWMRNLAESKVPADLRPKCDPSDVVQDALTEAHQKVRKFAGSERQFRAWLGTIVSHKAIDAGRKHRDGSNKKLREAATGPDDLTGPAPAADSPLCRLTQAEERRRLAAALAGLCPQHRYVLRLVYEERLSFGQIGEVLGRSARTARRRWAEAMAAWCRACEESRGE